LDYLKKNAEGKRDITVIKSISDLRDRLRPPLPLKLFVKCLKSDEELKKVQTPDLRFALDAFKGIFTLV